jgi:hypothetical protein
MIKHLLTKTNFRRLCRFEQSADEAAQDLPARQYYTTEFELSDPIIYGYLRVTTELNPETMHEEEVAEEDDKLLVPNPGDFMFNFCDNGRIN